MNLQKHVRRYDVSKITSTERTPQGFLKAPGFATRTGVFPYRLPNGTTRLELRHPDDVFDPNSLATLKNAPVTMEHPPEMVTPENVEKYMVGYTGDRVEVNRDLVEIDLIIANADAIKAVEEDGIRELSSGYLCDLEEGDGVYNGTPYTHRQRNIKYNHQAIVERGRAGPEVRLRMDSSDAVMEENSAGEILPAVAAEFAAEGETEDSEPSNQEGSGTGSESETRAVVVAGQSVLMPKFVADIWEDMSDRYDQTRAESTLMGAKLEQLEANMEPKKDVDVSQKGISPQVTVVQGAPDGRGGAAKKDGDMSPGVKEAKGLDAETPPAEGAKKDGEMPPEAKKDYEGAGQGVAGAGGGVAMSPFDQMKKDWDEMKAKNDEMQAKLDAYASGTMTAPNVSGGMPKTDSADFRQIVRARVNLERNAEKLVPKETVAKFDSLSDEEIMVAAIKQSDARFDSAGKSRSYLQARYDILTANMDAADKIRNDMGSDLLLKSRFDAINATDPAAKRKEMINNSKELHKQPLSAVKK